MLTYAITTPEGQLRSGQARALTVAAQDGELTILPGHAALATLLRPGETRIVDSDGKEEFFVLSGGFLQIANDNITVLADIAQRAEDLEAEAIEKAIAAAQEQLKNARNADDVEYTRISAALEHELAKHRVAMKRGKASRLAGRRDAV